MSHPQCVGLAGEVVLWHGFDDQSWVVLAEPPLSAAAIGTIALPLAGGCDWDDRPPACRRLRLG
jgi:hypothetical protein